MKPASIRPTSTCPCELLPRLTLLTLLTRLTRLTLLTLLALLPGADARAQSVNIDLGPPGAGPGNGYRAAGLPGHWHSFEATTWGEFHALQGLDGRPVAARVRQIGGTEIVVTAFTPGVDPEGGDAVLLEDALVTHAIENCLFFDNLQNGRYEVLSYAWMPTVPETLNQVWIDNHPDEPLIGGAWPGKLTEGVVYARHEFDVTTGVLNMHAGIPDGGAAEPGAALGGIQLRKMEPEPPLFLEPARAVWLASLNAVDYDVVAGDLATLRSTGGDFAVAAGPCVADDTPGTGTGHGADPAPGQGAWWLVRGNGGASSFTWNAPGGSQVGDRDAELAGSCP